MEHPVSTTSDYTIRDQERMKHAVQYFEWQRRLTEPQLGRRVLEIGCGMGNFTARMVDRDCVIGLDVEQECIDAHRKRFADQPHIESFVMDVLDPSFLDLRRYKPDSVVCLNVLEHISDDLKTLQHIHGVLPKGGKAVLMVPAFEALYGPIDKMLGHYRRYSKKSMDDVAKKAGFAASHCRYMNSIGWVGWFMNARILKRTEQSESQIAFFDSKVVPVLSRLEEKIEPPFGQSIFAVLTK